MRILESGRRVTSQWDLARLTLDALAKDDAATFAAVKDQAQTYLSSDGDALRFAQNMLCVVWYQWTNRPRPTNGDGPGGRS